MINKLTSIQTKAGFTAGGIIVLGFGFWLQVQYLLWGDWTYDQGFYFVVARLMREGFRPYHELHMTEQPLMALSAFLPFQLLDSIWGMQFFMVGYAMLGIAALISIGHILVSRLTGLLAGLLLVAHFEFFLASRPVNPETTSVSLALVAIALALSYRTSGRRYLLLLCAIAMAGSLLLKLFMVTVILLIALILLFFPASPGQETVSKEEWKRIIQDYTIWFGVMGIIIAVSWLAVGLPGLLEQSILFYIRRNAAHTYDLALNFGTLWQLLAKWPVLSLLGLWGVVIAIVQFKRYGWVVVSWLVLILVFLMTFSPLRNKHLTMIMPLIALLPAIALNQFIDVWQSRRRSQAVLKWGGGVALALCFALLVIEMVTPFRRLAKPNKPLVEEDRAIITEGLEKFTSPADCIITDDPYIAFVSGRLPPPWLSNMSYARFESGSLDTQELIEITNHHNCQAVVPTFARIKNGNRPYYDWAKGNYLRTWVVAGKEIMLGKPLTNANPVVPIYANFANQVELLGLDWVEDNSVGSKHAYVSLYWRSLKPFSKNYKIFIQLRDATGRTIASADHEAFDGLLPTQLWPVNLILKDTNGIPIPDDISPGNYALFVGLYDPASVERLRIVDDASGENAVVFTDIVIQ